jgi:glutathione peroxidase
MKFYVFTVKGRAGEDVALSTYKGKVLLVVNTATGCGFSPQYEGLQILYDAHKDKGFEILDFPCNQFAKQAPGTIEEIQSFCTLNYGTTFPRFAKIDVNGRNASDLYKFLKKEKKAALGSSIKWNFTKFLIDREGNLVKRFAPTDTPESIEKDILALL